MGYLKFKIYSTIFFHTINALEPYAHITMPLNTFIYEYLQSLKESNIMPALIRYKFIIRFFKQI